MELPINYAKAHWTTKRTARQQYAQQQGEKCWYCNKPLISPPSKKVQKMSVNKSLFPKGFFIRPTHLHHDHNTGMTIGTVHSKCNAVLWQYHGE